MEQDTEMADGADANYPDPPTAISNPYPNSEQTSSIVTAPGYTPLNDSIQFTPQRPTSNPSAPTTGFSTTEEFFRLGEKALFNLHGLVRTTDQARRWNEVAHNVSNASAAYASSSHTPPTSTPQTFSTSSWSLPGYHALPDIDRLHNGTPNSQTSSTSPSTVDSPTPARGSGIRRGPGRPKGSGRGGWRQVLKGTEHADLFKPNKYRPDRGQRKRGRTKGKVDKRTADPGPEFKVLQSKAMTAFLDNDLDAAREHALAALHINPEVWASYSLLSEIAQKQGHELESIQILGSGAPVKRDANVWVDVATRLMEYRGDDKTDVELAFALKCCDQAIKLEGNHIDARSARLGLYVEQKSWNKARRECGTLLALQPNNLALLWRYAEFCDRTGMIDDVRGAIDEYEKAFQLYTGASSFGPEEQQWDHLNTYLDMVSKVGPPEKGVYQLKRIARWFVGRQQDTFWNDIHQDDREFDDTPERRHLVPQVQTGNVAQDSARYGLGLPIELRVKLGLFRLQMAPSNHTEAYRHFEHLRRLSDPTDIQELYDLFLDVANNLRLKNMFGAAIDYFERLRSVSEFLGRDYWMNFGQCCREIGRNEEAEECYKKVIATNEDEVPARINLIRLYESTAQSMKALPLADEIIRIGRSEALNTENMETYITACKRIKKKAAKADKAEKATRTADSPVNKETGVVQKPRKRVPKPTPANKARSVKIAPTPTPWDEGTDEEDGDTERREESVEQQSPTSTHAVKMPTFKRGGDYLNSLREQRIRVRAEYEKLCDLWPQRESAPDSSTAGRWIQHAAALAKDFKLIREFYPTTSREKLYAGLRTGGDASVRALVSEMEAMKKGLLEDAARLGQPDGPLQTISTAQAEFHGISFSDWHRIFANLALLYASKAQQEECYALLRRVLMPANVFRNDEELRNATLSVSLCCALMFNDSKFAFETTKQFRDIHDAPALSQLAAAFGRLEYGDTELLTRKSQYWLSSAVDEHDYLAMQPETREKYDWGKATERLSEKAEQAGSTPTVIDAGLLTAYSHAIDTTQRDNFSTALPYLFRALALDPDNVVINLSIATSYIAQAMRKTQAARQNDICRGVAFLHRYYDLRIADGKACHVQEAEFNLARLWHLLDMNHLAIPGYEKVLKLSVQVQQQNRQEEGKGNLCREAALALQCIYSAAGNEEAAHSIAHEWMVL